MGAPARTDDQAMTDNDARSADTNPGRGTSAGHTTRPPQTLEGRRHGDAESLGLVSDG